jgi:uncharacterized protein (TIGR03067 family)
MTERDIFLAVLDLPDPTARATYLDAACRGDTARRAQVEALIRSHEAAGSFLAEPAVATPEPNSPARTLPLEPGDATPARGTSGQADDPLDFLSPPRRPDSLGRIGHYEVLQVIGQGGFGTVFRAFDEKLHRVVAIKVLSPAFAVNAAARKRFTREARAAAAVKNEHVVGIYEVQEDAQPPYLVMECIDGISLQDKLDKHGTLGVTEILRIGMQTAEGLAAAHKQGLVHRDIKPANILLDNGVERVKITDFGLARAVDDASVTQSGTVAGTPMYMSPEQAEGLVVDHRSDLFSLGTVLYAMCTGHPPFRASGTHAVLKRVIEDTPRPIREINGEIPEWLCAIVTRLHAKKPEDRLQTATEVAELLRQYLAHLQQATAVPMPAPPALPQQRRVPAEAADELNGRALRQVRTPAIGLFVTGIAYWAAIPFAFWLRFQEGVQGSDSNYLWWAIGVVPAVAGFLLIFGGWIMLRGEDYRLAVIAACVPLLLLAEKLLALQQGRFAMVPGDWTALPFGMWALIVLNRRDVIAAFAHANETLTERPRTPKTETADKNLLKAVVDHAARTMVYIFLYVGLAFAIRTFIPGQWHVGWAGAALLGFGLLLVALWRLQRPDSPLRETAKFLSLMTLFLGMCCVIVGLYVWLQPEHGGSQPISKREVEARKVDTRPLSDAEPSAADGFVPLFNGRDLTGWKTHPDQPGDWRVEDGVLIGRGPRSHLFSQRGDYEDFHLRVEAKINNRGNSGVYFRSENGLGWGVNPKGYEAQIFEGDAQDPYKTGSLYSLAKVTSDLVKPNTWFTLEVIAQGNRTVIKVDGKTAVDFVDEAARYKKGHFALQVERPPGTIVQFRKIEVKELYPAGIANAALPALRDLVAAKERERKMVKARFDAGTVNPLDMLAVEVELTTARIRLAEAEEDRKAILAGLQELAAQRKEERRIIAVKVDVGAATPDALDQADGRLADAQARLSQARPAAPVEVGGADRAMIQGTWTGVSAEMQGQRLPDLVLKAIAPTITFDGDKVTWRANPTPEAKDLFGRLLADARLEGVFHLDPTKSPKTIDLTVLGQNAKTPIGTPAPRALLGIYRLDGDSLELCIAIDPDHAEERPTRFESVPRKFISHIKLRRQSP